MLWLKVWCTQACTEGWFRKGGCGNVIADLLDFHSHRLFALWHLGGGDGGRNGGGKVGEGEGGGGKGAQRAVARAILARAAVKAAVAMAERVARAAQRLRPVAVRSAVW